MKKLIVLLVISCLLCAGMGCGETVKTVIDVNQFSRISPTELTQIMGDPESVENWNYKTGAKTFPAKTYYYQNGKYEFLVIDNAVVRFTVNSEGQDSFNNEKDIFAMFNVVPSSNIKKVANTGYALRYQMVSDKIADVWILGIEKKAFDIAKFTYDLRYFE